VDVALAAAEAAGDSQNGCASQDEAFTRIRSGLKGNLNAVLAEYGLSIIDRACDWEDAATLATAVLQTIAHKGCGPMERALAATSLTASRAVVNQPCSLAIQQGAFAILRDGVGQVGSSTAASSIQRALARYGLQSMQCTTNWRDTSAVGRAVLQSILKGGFASPEATIAQTALQSSQETTNDESSAHIHQNALRTILNLRISQAA